MLKFSVNGSFMRPINFFDIRASYPCFTPACDIVAAATFTLISLFLNHVERAFRCTRNLIEL